MGNGNGELQEIVTVDQIGRLFVLLAILLPLVGAGIGYLLGAKRGHGLRGLRTGGTMGLIGPANWLLWQAYNLITDRLGLDTVLNFAVNLTLFVVIGISLGLMLRRYIRKLHLTQESEVSETRAQDH